MGLASKTYKKYIDNTNQQLEIEINIEEVSYEDNVSTINWEVYLNTGSDGAISSSNTKKWEFTFIGSSTYYQYGYVSISMGANSSKKLASGTFNYTRISSDSISLPFEFQLDLELTWSGTWISTWNYMNDFNLQSVFNLPTVSQFQPFTDESNPSMTITGTGDGLESFYVGIISYWKDWTTIIEPVEIPLTLLQNGSINYELELTQEQRSYLRTVWLADTTSVTVYYYLYGFDYSGNKQEKFAATTLRLADDKLTLTPRVYDTNSKTVALTGDENIMVRYYSNATYNMNPEILKEGSTVTTSYVINGSKKVSGITGTINAVDSGLFKFYAKTSRGYVADAVIEKDMVNYINLTCHQDIKAEISGEDATGAIITLDIGGDYYNGSFGAVDNELKIEVKHTQNDGTMGDWVELTDGLIPVFSDGSYSLNVEISGFSYDRAYTFVCRATDKLNTATTTEYTVKIMPVFDWSDEDFNCNVPFRLNNHTVLRHNKDANNLVVSASGGHIYLRPGGTDNTTGEIKITPGGNIELTGDILINGQSLKSLLGIT